MSTLRYASRAKNIVNKPTVNEVPHPPQSFLYIIIPSPPPVGSEREDNPRTKRRDRETEEYH